MGWVELGWIGEREREIAPTQSEMWDSEEREAVGIWVLRVWLFRTNSNHQACHCPYHIKDSPTPTPRLLCYLFFSFLSPSLSLLFLPRIIWVPPSPFCRLLSALLISSSSSSYLSLPSSLLFQIFIFPFLISFQSCKNHSNLYYLSMCSDPHHTKTNISAIWEY